MIKTLFFMGISSIPALTVAMNPDFSPPQNTTPGLLPHEFAAVIDAGLNKGLPHSPQPSPKKYNHCTIKKIIKAKL